MITTERANLPGTIDRNVILVILQICSGVLETVEFTKVWKYKMFWCCLVAEWLDIIGSLQSMTSLVNKLKGQTTITKTNAEKVSKYEICLDIYVVFNSEITMWIIVPGKMLLLDPYRILP